MRISYYPDFTYLNQPDKRAEIGRGELISCGDIGRLDQDGFLYLCDRKRDMVISGGVNIYPAEIEAVLNALDDIQDCAVFGIPDEEFGEAVIALIQPVPGATISISNVRLQLEARLARYKQPKHIEIRHDLPREDSGKIFKRLLREPYWHSNSTTV